MAEHEIDTDAQVFAIDLKTPHSWICRDDNGDFWTVFRNTSDNLEVYKSTDVGATWVLKKTLQNSDFTGGDPFPTNAFQIINLIGQDKVYLLISSGAHKYAYGWIFNVTADTDAKDIDYVFGANATVGPYWGCWDSYNSRLLYLAWGSGNIDSIGEINLDTTLSEVGYNGGLGDPYSYYISAEGYGYAMATTTPFGTFLLTKLKRGASDYHQNEGGQATLTYSGTLLFLNIVSDTSSNPIVGWAETHTGAPRLRISKRDKDNTATELIAADHAFDSGTNPTSCFVTVDGNDNIIFVFTDGSDNEAYYIKYDGSSWGAETKISLDNDGKLVMPEFTPPLSASSLILTYQATA